MRQLRDVIDEVYASKAKHDAKCVESRLPRETLSQHLSTYLQNRYGLKLLVHEYVAPPILALPVAPPVAPPTLSPAATTPSSPH